MWQLRSLLASLAVALVSSTTVVSDVKAQDERVDRLWLMHRTADAPGFADGNWKISLRLYGPGMGATRMLCPDRLLRKPFDERQGGRGNIYEIAVSKCELTRGDDFPRLDALEAGSVHLTNEEHNLWLPDAIWVIGATPPDDESKVHSKLIAARPDWNCWFGPSNKRKGRRDRPAKPEWSLADEDCF